MLTKKDLQDIKGIVKGSETRLKKEIGKVQKDLKFAIKFLDKQDIRIEERVTKIEEHLHFPQN